MADVEWRIDTEEGFMACYHATAGGVFRYASMLCGRDRGAAEDLTQDVFMGLVRRARDHSVSTVTLGYLTIAVRRRFLDEMKRRDREQRRLQVVGRDRTGEREVPAGLEQLADLPERERLAMVLRFADDLLVSEVGRTMGISTRAAESLLARATRRLRGGDRQYG